MARAYTPIGWENGTKEAEAYVTISGVDYEVTPEQWDGNTPVDATNLDHMEKGIQNSYDVKLLAVTDTEPSECATGDIYYNTTNKLLYTATGTDTWSSTGTEPLEGILYIVFDEENNKGNSYSWNGSDLSSVGGGGGAEYIAGDNITIEDTSLGPVISANVPEEVIISDEEPTTDDWKIWIDSGEVNNLGSEVVDSLAGNETNFAPSVRAVKEDLNNYSTEEQRIGTYLGKPLYRKTINTYTLNSEEAEVQAVYDFSNDSTFINTILIKNFNLSITLQYRTTNNYFEKGLGNNGNYIGTFGFNHNMGDSPVLNVLRTTYNQAYIIRSMELTLEYTKTTD